MAELFVEHSFKLKIILKKTNKTTTKKEKNISVTQINVIKM
jgi:hypothetical protein